MLKKKLFVLIQNVVPQHLLSWFMGKAANSQCKLLKNFMISYFIKRYQVDMSMAQLENVADYPSFNAFFTRALKSNARPIAAGDNTVISPVDGCISQIGKIQDQTLIQAKKANYSLDTLVGGFRDVAEKFIEAAGEKQLQILLPEHKESSRTADATDCFIPNLSELYSLGWKQHIHIKEGIIRMLDSMN